MKNNTDRYENSQQIFADEVGIIIPTFITKTYLLGDICRSTVVWLANSLTTCGIEAKTEMFEAKLLKDEATNVTCCIELRYGVIAFHYKEDHTVVSIVPKRTFITITNDLYAKYTSNSKNSDMSTGAMAEKVYNAAIWTTNRANAKYFKEANKAIRIVQRLWNLTLVTEDGSTFIPIRGSKQYFRKHYRQKTL